jgi:hypothetical protein
MNPRAFDTAAPNVQEALFAADSQGYCGPDLFNHEAADEAADEIKAGDLVIHGTGAPMRVAEVGAGWVELGGESLMPYRIETMHVRKAGNAR